MQERRILLRKINVLSQKSQDSLLKYILTSDLINESFISSENLKKNSISTIVVLILSRLGEENKQSFIDNISNFLEKISTQPKDTKKFYSELLSVEKNRTRSLIRPFFIQTTETLTKENDPLKVQRNAIKAIFDYNGFSSNMSHFLSNLVVSIDESKEMVEKIDSGITSLISEDLPRNIDPEYVKELLNTSVLFSIQLKKMINQPKFIALSIAYYIFQESSNLFSNEIINSIRKITLNSQKLDQNAINEIESDLSFNDEAIHEAILEYTARVLESWGIPFRKENLNYDLESFHYLEGEDEIRISINPFPWFS